ncbi:MAG: hypothetical protein O7B25_02410 [Gammaproteobacteria bacterium]|nr:hypothetical protein [Gammaproteobacteria bacterium]
MKIAITTLVIIHLIAILWHGDAHTTLAIELPVLKNIFVYGVIVAGPIVGTSLIWTRFSALGTCLIAVSMVGALMFGVYHHYVLVSPDNIAHLPNGAVNAQTQFIDSAAVIAIIELISALVGFFALGQTRATKERLG